MALNIVKDYLPDNLAWNGKSGNYSRTGNIPAMLVMHATGGTLESCRSWFRSRKSGVSSHYVIAKSGDIYAELPETAIAYTVGRSRWQGRTNLNDESINIELVNADNYLDPYPKDQYNAAVELAKEIVARYHIQSENVVSHGQVAIPKGRKHDPAGFDMERFKYDVFSAPLDFGRWGQPTDPNSPIGGVQDAGNKQEAEPKDDNPTPLQSTSFWERFLSVFSGQNKDAGILSEFQRLLGLKR